MALAVKHGSYANLVCCSGHIIASNPVANLCNKYGVAGKSRQQNGCGPSSLQRSSTFQTGNRLDLRHAPGVLRWRSMAYGPTIARSGGGSSGSPDPNPQETALKAFTQIERVITQNAYDWKSSALWEEVAGAWVRPADGPPKAVVHFIGGSFVGACPQLTYKLLLERLAARNIYVIATPYSTILDHMRIADEVQFKYDRCVRALEERGDDIRTLPVYGIGHSLGSVIQLLIGSRYAVERAGNVHISFNNKPVVEAVPFFSPMISPMAQNLGPILDGLQSSPILKNGFEMAAQQFKGVSPPLMRQLLPFVEQLQLLYKEVSSGRADFTPTPAETARLVKAYYSTSRNMLIRFSDDTIDETSTLAALLQESAVGSILDLTLRALPGDHARPLQQPPPDIPPEVAEAASRGGALFESLAGGTPLGDLAKGISALGRDSKSNSLKNSIRDNMDKLVDELIMWMDLHPRMPRSLPAPQSQQL